MGEALNQGRETVPIETEKTARRSENGRKIDAQTWRYTALTGSLICSINLTELSSQPVT